METIDIPLLEEVLEWGDTFQAKLTDHLQRVRAAAPTLIAAAQGPQMDVFDARVTTRWRRTEVVGRIRVTSVLYISRDPEDGLTEEEEEQ